MSSPSPSPPPAGYDPVAKALHWLIALLVLALVGIGLVMTRVLDGFGPERFTLFQLHKSLGFTVLALMALRIAWRLTHRPPEPVGGMAPWERLAARGAHLALYLLLVLLPLAGWAVVSSSPLPVPTRYFGLFDIPHIGAVEGLSAADKAVVHSRAGRLHSYGGFLLIAVIALHAAAALRHHFLKKDETLTRMLPFGRRRPSQSAWLVVIGAGLLAFTALALHAPARAAAPAWTVDPAASAVTFEAAAGGQVVTGKVGRFDVRLRFDPLTLEGTELAVTIDVASIGTGNGQIDAALLSPDWLDADSHPTATYTAAAAKRTGADSFELEGELTLKGIRKALPLPFTLKEDGAGATATGSLAIDRLAFGIGQGQAAEAVAPEVKVTVTLVARRQ